MTSSLAPPDTLFADRVRRIGTEAAFAFGALIGEVEAQGERVIRCNLGQPDFPLPMPTSYRPVHGARAP